MYRVVRTSSLRGDRWWLCFDDGSSMREGVFQDLESVKAAAVSLLIAALTNVNETSFTELFTHAAPGSGLWLRLLMTHAPV
nr:hypothetical protein CFP56_57667 [Quercus suber]